MLSVVSVLGFLVVSSVAMWGIHSILSDYRDFKHRWPEVKLKWTDPAPYIVFIALLGLFGVVVTGFGILYSLGITQ